VADFNITASDNKFENLYYKFLSQMGLIRQFSVNGIGWTA